MAEEGAAVAGSTDAGGTPSGSAVSAPTTPDWGAFKSTLGDMGKDKSLEPIKDFHGLTKSYIEAQKMIGGSIRLPPKDAKPEDRTKAVNDILGKLRKEGVIESVPESPDKYDIKTPTMEGWKGNEPLITGFKEIAHKTGVTPTQAQALFDWYLNFQESSEAQSQAEFEEMKAGMKREMGGLYTRRMEAARRAVAKYIGADGDQLISSLPPAVGKKLVMAFAEIGDPLLEDALIQGERLGVSSLSDTEKKINEIVANKSHPLWDVSNPGHNKAVEEWSALQRVFIELKGRKQ
jgi:hypothetical protein